MIALIIGNRKVVVNKFIYLLLLFFFSCGIQEDCMGVLNGASFVDDCGVCVGGTSGLIENYLMDECNICEGEGAIYECGCFDLPENDCDCDGNVLSEDGICDDIDDCVGEYDECGVCNGSGTSECWDGLFVCDLANCEEESDNIVNVLYDTDTAIAGFQFHVEGVEVTGASGGAAEAADFTISTSV